MEKKQDGRKLRTQLLVMFIGAMALTLATVCLVNVAFLGRYYRFEKQKKMLETYQRIDSLVSSGSSDLTSEIKQISVQDNIQVLVTDYDFESITSTSRDAEELAARLFGYYTGFYREHRTILRQTDTYTLQETSDRVISTDYLEMWGQMTEGNWFLLRTPLESIENATRISNLFYIIVGLAATAVSMVCIFVLSHRLTRPIEELSDLSKRMAALDFDARYTGHAGNEIDQLGENFNLMSKELEQTVSELKSANVELQKDVERRVQIDEMRQEFLNNVSHELKTPIALIQGYAEGLRDGVADDPDSLAFYLDVIIDEAGKMNTMVRKLLTLNQLEFGNDPINMERFDLTELIGGVLAKMQIMIEESGAEVSVNRKEPCYVWGDAFKIEEVVTNYVSNAIHHLGGSRRIDIQLTEKDGLVTTSVFNTGDPIPEDSVNRVFEKFYKVDKARTREYGGSGIGLSIVKAIMDGHGQKCGVRNYKDGVLFYFTLESKA